MIVLGMLTLALSIHQTEAKTIIVPDNYDTIQQAVDAAISGDIIEVRAGTYAENVIISGKSISLIGEDPHRTTLRNGQYKSG